MPVRTIYLPDDLDRAVAKAVEDRPDDENRSNVIQDALRECDELEAIADV